jgi:predicted RND superfamily exporter protein
MNHRSSLIVIALAAVVLTPSAYAYISPDEFIGVTPAPPTHREAEGIVKAREQERIGNIVDAQKEMAKEVNASLASSSSSVTSSVAAQSTQSSSVTRDLFNPDWQYQQRMQRIQDNAGRNPTIIIQQGSDGVYVQDANGKVLHSGAPRVAGTGPKEFIAVLVLALAAGATFLLAAKREKRQVTMS